MPKPTKYTLDFVFSSNEAQGSMNAWGYSYLMPGEKAPKQGSHKDKSGPKPDVQHLSTNVPFSVRIFDTAYDTNSQYPKLEMVCVAFERNDGLPDPAPQSPIILPSGGTWNSLQWYASPQIAPDNPDKFQFSDGTKLEGGMWEIPGPQMMTSIENCTLGNPTLYKCRIFVAIVMSDSSRKVFITDPEMDVEAGG